MHYVIIGGGIAGTTAAEELRNIQPQAEITLIDEEEHALYSRVLLPHYVKRKILREKVFLKKTSWYDKKNIEWLCGESVVKIDPKNQFVEISSGREVSYDVLLIATGGDVRLIADDIFGVSYFRTLNDADHLMEMIRSLAKDARVGIYGGGFIACEYLNMFQAFGLPTMIAFRGEHFWSNSFSREAGELLNQHLQKNKVEVFSNAKFIRTIGEKKLEGFATTQGIHNCSILGVGIGIAPNFSFLQDIDIEVQEGIVCNQFLQTNIPNIFTAGDVAEFFDERFGRHVRMGNWMNATMQGRLVAKNMGGEKQSFNLVSSYATNALGLEIIFIGDVSRIATNETKLFGSIESGGITEVFIRNNQVVGAVLVGRNFDRKILTKAIQDKVKAENIDNFIKN